MHLSGGTLLQGGKYKIVRYIGGGGFSYIYEAEYLMLRRRVAIMEVFVRDFFRRNDVTNHIIITDESKTPFVCKYKDMFIAQARVVSKLNHQNIVNVTDVFEENGTAYLVMDYIDGRPLSEMVNGNGPLSEAEALNYIRQIADALAYVHSNKLLHLDIRPGNIMVDGSGHAVLIDFGASKQYDECDDEITSTVICMTHGYSPIEQYSSSCLNKFSPQTDIYSLGATLYKLLTGKQPPEAIEFGLPSLPETISASVRNAVNRAMQPMRKNRPQSVEEFLELLDGEKKLVSDKLSETLRIGSALQGGKYRIEQVLGQGGFGITYLAVQVGLNRRVAIKEFFMENHSNRSGSTSDISVSSEGSNKLVEQYRAKFIKEAQTIANLVHENIIKIYDIFEENGTAYYVMEYHNGNSLKQLVDMRGKLSETDSLYYIRQVASALSYIHKRSINHLDIKPGNILLSSDNNAVLIDFGVSKHYDSQGRQITKTPVGISPGYAPMEQYKQGGVAEFSPTTDIYSLGATLFKLLTGKTPPEANDVYDSGLPSLPANISQSTRNAVEHAMQPRRKDRPQSVDEFLLLLDTDDITLFLPTKRMSETINGLSISWDSGVTSSQKDVLRNLVWNMLEIEGGTFRMGNNSFLSLSASSPIHDVTLSSYRIGKYEVTQREWVAVMGSNPSSFRGDNLPVERVSWNDCKTFILRLNSLTGLSFRLPTEAEWEYAARGGNKSIGYLYSGGDNIGNVAWYDNNSNKKIHLVGQKSANELGLYDMSGNVWEWCSDWYCSSYYSSSPRMNPRGPKSGSYRVRRGGSWNDVAGFCRILYRSGKKPLYASNNLGFRLAL